MNTNSYCALCTACSVNAHCPYMDSTESADRIQRTLSDSKFGGSFSWNLENLFIANVERAKLGAAKK